MRKTKGRGVAKVIFLVNQVALANQQAVACESQLKKYKTKVISGDTQRSKGECLKDFIDKYDFSSKIVLHHILLLLTVNFSVSLIFLGKEAMPVKETCPPYQLNASVCLEKS